MPKIVVFSKKNTDKSIKTCSHRRDNIDRGIIKYYPGEKKYRDMYDQAKPASPEKLAAAQKWTDFIVRYKSKKGKAREKTPGHKGVRRNAKGQILQGSTLNPNGNGGKEAAKMREMVQVFLAGSDK